MKRVAKAGGTTNQQVDKFWARKFNITSFLFDKQLSFVEDPAPFKVAVCSRRAGKTTACAAHLIYTAVNNPDSTNLYITLSSVSGKRIIWKEFKKIVKNYGLGDHSKLNDADLSIVFDNGATIYVVGAKDASEIEKFRGLPIKLCYIDECQSFRAYIQDLIDDIIGPALIDYAGSLCLIGTPGPIPVGYFYDCSVKSEAWSKHGWTFWDNPHIPITAKKTHQEVFDREMKRRGITDLSEPSVQREWFGKWVLDSDSLLIKYKSDKSDYGALPPRSKFNYVMGVDIGFNDADAIAVLGWSDDSPTTYLIEELIEPKQGITELVDQIKALQKKYDIAKIVMDMGGLGLKIGEEMSRRYQVPVEPADKKRKMENVELLNDALRSGRFKAKGNSRFAQDSYLVEIDKDKSTPERIKVSDRFHSDIIDAVLYAFKISPAYTYEPPTEKPQYGTKAWADAQSNAMWEAEMNGHMAEIEESKKNYGQFD